MTLLILPELPSLRQRRYPFPGLSPVSGWMLLFSHPGDRLVLGGGERGCGGAEAQSPERHSHAGATGEKWAPHNYHPPGTDRNDDHFRA